MKPRAHFMYITLNCIVLAIATGLVTVVMLIAIVLLINSPATVAGGCSNPWSYIEGNAACLLHDNSTDYRDARHYRFLQSPPPFAKRGQQGWITCNHNPEVIGTRLLYPRFPAGNTPGRAVLSSPGSNAFQSVVRDRKEVKINPGQVTGTAGLPTPTPGSFAMSWPGTKGLIVSGPGRLFNLNFAPPQIS